MAKRLLKWVALALLGLFAVALVGGLMIDPEIELRTEATLAARPATVFEMVSTPKGVQRWWRDAGEALGHQGGDMTVEPVSETEVLFKAGGRTMETWKRQALDPGKSALWEVEFGGMMTVQRTLGVRQTKDGATVVTWRETGRLGNPLLRWMKVLMPPESVIANFDKALKLLEKRASAEKD